tara:strand:- start:404 stop:565 length:162 start_codon:yes stop_codon:yes gene_type:complete
MYHFFLKDFSRVIFILFKGTICYFKLILTGIFFMQVIIQSPMAKCQLKNEKQS